MAADAGGRVGGSPGGADGSGGGSGMTVPGITTGPPPGGATAFFRSLLRKLTMTDRTASATKQAPTTRPNVLAPEGGWRRAGW